MYPLKKLLCDMPKLSDAIKLPEGRTPSSTSTRLPSPENKVPTSSGSSASVPENGTPSANVTDRQRFPGNPLQPFDKRTNTGNFLENSDLYQELRTETMKWANRLTNLGALSSLYAEFRGTQIAHLPKDSAQSLFRKELPGILGPGLGDYIKTADSVLTGALDITECRTVEEYLYAIVAEYIKRDTKGLTKQVLNKNSNPMLGVSSKGTDYIRKTNPSTLAEHASAKIMFDKINSDIVSNGREAYGALDEGKKLFTSPADAFKYFPFKGYKNLLGLSLDSTHTWDIRIEPFLGEINYEGTQLPTKFSGLAPDSAYTPLFPITQLTSGITFNYNDWMPIVSYEYTEGSLEGREVALFGTSSIFIPLEFTSSGTINLVILDDENKSMVNYWTEYFNTVYDAKTHAVADYKDICFMITLYLYRGDRKITGICELIVIPTTYSSTFNGTDEPGHEPLSVGFKVVGQLDTKAFATSANVKITALKTIVT